MEEMLNIIAHIGIPDRSTPFPAGPGGEQGCLPAPRRLVLAVA
ncbi:MAG: hypothetical protein ABRQ24_06585 [Syntrophomonadaceae bacterium]